MRYLIGILIGLTIGLSLRFTHRSQVITYSSIPSFQLDHSKDLDPQKAFRNGLQCIYNCSNL